MDKIYMYLRDKNGGVGRPEFRLRKLSPLTESEIFTEVNRPAILFPGTIFLPVGLLITGWTVQEKTHWIGPDFVSQNILMTSLLHLTAVLQGLLFVGAGIILVFQPILHYIIDAFTLHAASGKDLIPSKSHRTTIAFSPCRRLLLKVTCRL
jgi:hypothetical protein